MTSIKRGEIYWANLNPTLGGEISKTRPILVVSNNINNQYSATVTVLPVTSNTTKVYPFEVAISASESGLQKDSKIKADQIRTIDKQRLTDKIGSITGLKMDEVEQSILIHLGIKT